MQYQFIIIGLVAFIAVLLLVIRTNSAIVFFCLCAGSLLATQVGGETSLLLSSFIKNGDTSRAIASISLILLPVFFSALILRKSLSSGMLLANLAPSIAVGLLAVLLVIPYIPINIREQLTNNIAWNYLDKFQPIIIVTGILSSIFLLWLTSRGHSKKHKKHKK